LTLLGHAHEARVWVSFGEDAIHIDKEAPYVKEDLKISSEYGSISISYLSGERVELSPDVEEALKLVRGVEALLKEDTWQPLLIFSREDLRRALLGESPEHVSTRRKLPLREAVRLLLKYKNDPCQFQSFAELYMETEDGVLLMQGLLPLVGEALMFDGETLVYIEGYFALILKIYVEESDPKKLISLLEELCKKKPK
jgi:hypothetical protein